MISYDDTKTALALEPQSPGHIRLENLASGFAKKDFKLSSIPSLIESLKKPVLDDQLYGLIGFGKILSPESLDDREPAIQAVIKSGAVPLFNQIMINSCFAKIKVEACYCLMKACETWGEIKEPVRNEATQSLITLLESSDSVLAQTLVAIHYLASSYTEWQMKLLENNVAHRIVEILEKNPNEVIKDHCYLTLVRLCQRTLTSIPPYEHISTAVPVLCNYLKQHEDDKDILHEVLRALLSPVSLKEGLDDVLSYELTGDLVRLLGHSKLPVINHCLKLIQSILDSGEKPAAMILQGKSLVPAFVKLADHPKIIVRRSLFFTIGKIFEKKLGEFEEIMKDDDFVGKIINAVKNEDPSIRKQLVEDISKSTKKCNEKQILVFLENGIYSCLFDLLGNEDQERLLAVLEGIENCLQWGKKDKLDGFIIEARGKKIDEKLKNVKKNGGNKIKSQVDKILKYF